MSTQKEIFKAAHTATRLFMRSKRAVGCHYVAMFSFFLKSEYAKAKAALRKTAAFFASIIKETENAVLASCTLTRTVKKMNSDFEYVKVDEISRIESWFPKSVIKAGSVASWFVQKEFGVTAVISF